MNFGSHTFAASSFDATGAVAPRAKAKSSARIRCRTPLYLTSSHHGCAQRGLALQPLLRQRFRTAIVGPPSRHGTLVGAPRRIQSRTSSGRNLLPLTPNRCNVSSPRRYARRTVSSWQPTNLATSKAVSRGLRRPSRSRVIASATGLSTRTGSESEYRFLMGLLRGSALIGVRQMARDDGQRYGVSAQPCADTDIDGNDEPGGPARR